MLNQLIRNRLIHRILTAVVMTAGGLISASPANAQTKRPIYVDESPRASDLLLRASENIESNAGEAVRLFQQLLDNNADRLTPIRRTAPDHFTSIRRQVLSSLRSNPEVLRRYRLVEDAEATRLLDVGDLARLVRTRSLTDAGLTALLRSGQAAWEDARFDAAIHLFDEAIAHPTFPVDDAQAIATWHMLGAAAAYAAEADSIRAGARDWYMARVDRAILELGVFGEAGNASAAELNRVRVDAAGAWPARGGQPGRIADAPAVSELVTQTIWEVQPRRLTEPSDEDLAERAAEKAATEKSVNASAVSAAANRTTATITDDAVYVNNPVNLHAVQAFDRFTGQRLWDQAFVDRYGSGDQTLRDPPQDLRLIAVRGTSLITLIGDRSADSPRGSVVRLDARTGEQVWKKRFHQLANNPDYEGMYPHGRPILGTRSVYVLARRVTSENVMGTYVVSLSLADGTPEWIRHVSSIGITQPGSYPVSSLLFDRGRLFAATSAGAIASLDAGTGEFLWLVRLAGERPRAIAQPPAWEIIEPVLAENSLVVLRPDRRRLLVFDSDTGSMESSIDVNEDSAWAGTRYLLSRNGIVFSIGRTVRAFDIDLLTTPRWTLSIDDGNATSATGPSSAASDRPVGDADGAAVGEPDRNANDIVIPIPRARPMRSIESVGRAILTYHDIILPARDGMHIIDQETGQLLRTLDVDAHGTPAALDSQLVIANDDEVRSYMSMTRAESMIRERIVAHPDNPRPALSLLRLAVRVNEPGLALEAGELAWSAIRSLRANGGGPDAGDAQRRQLFAEIMNLDTSTLEADSTVPDRIFALVEQIVTTPAERTIWLLTYGAWIEDEQPDRAIALYQSVVREPFLRSEWMTTGGRRRPAGAMAIERIRGVIDREGRAVYASFDQEATRKLAQLRAAGDVSPAALNEVALQFPFASAADEAVLEAATLLSDAGSPGQAASVILAAWRFDPTDARTNTLIGGLLKAFETSGRSDFARTIASSIAIGNPDASVVMNGAPISLAAYAGIELEFRDEPAPERPASVKRGRFTGEARIFTGKIIPRSPDVADFTIPGLVLVREFPYVQGLSDVDLEVKWQYSIGNRAARRLGVFPDGGIVLMTGTDQSSDGMNEAPQLICLDPETGEPRWESAPLDEFLNRPLSLSGSTGSSKLPSGRPLRISETIARHHGDRAYMLQRNGGIAAYAMEDGTIPLWTREDVLRHTHVACATPFGLVVSGIHTLEQRPVVMLFDPDTGDTLQTIRLENRNGVWWMEHDGLGIVFIGTDETVEALDVLRGEEQWICEAPAAGETSAAWVVGESLIVRDTTSGYRPIDRREGTIGGPFDIFDASIANGGVSVYPLPRSLIVCSQNRVVRYAHDGTVLGVDAITDEGTYTDVAVGQDRVYVINYVDSTNVNDPETRRPYNVNSYWLYALDGSMRVLDGPHELANLRPKIRSQPMLAGNWLLMRLTSDTIAIPLMTEDSE